VPVTPSYHAPTYMSLVLYKHLRVPVTTEYHSLTIMWDLAGWTRSHVSSDSLSSYCLIHHTLYHSLQSYINKGHWVFSLAARNVSFSDYTTVLLHNSIYFYTRNLDYIMMLSPVLSIDSFSKFSPLHPNSITWNSGSQGGIGICCHY